MSQGPFSNAVKVGLFAAAALAILSYFILRIEDLRLFAPAGQRVDALFDSVAGLDEKSAVRVAGVRVGQVERIALDGARARVTLLLERPVSLRAVASAAIANLGLLGDKYVTLDPGPPGDDPLPPGRAIPGATPLSFDDAMARLDAVATSIEDVTRSITGGGPPTSVSRLIANLEETSGLIRDLVAANRAQVSSTIANFDRLSGTLAAELPKLTEQLARVLGQVESVVAENRESLRGGLGNVEELTAGLRSSVADLNKISARIAAGEGTIGKLVASDEAHNELVATLQSVQTGVEGLGQAFNRVRDLKLHLGFEGTYLEDVEDSATAFSLELDPPNDRFYLVELVDDPRGRQRSKTETVTVVGPDGGEATTTTRTVRVEDEVTLTAQLGIEMGRARLRGGLLQSTGGVGVDYDLFDRRLWMTLDAFDFSRESAGRDLDPRLRLTGEWRLNPNLYLLGGLDDLLVDDRRSLFLGAGLRWDDDDLKYLLGSIPSVR